MEKQGANDGSTKGSVQQAFSKFTYTPLITGEDFENKGSYDDPREKKHEGEKDYNKDVKVYKHHHEHHHGHEHGHGHLHAHQHGHKHGHKYYKNKHDDEYKHDKEYKHEDGYKHDEYKKDEYNHDEYKKDEYKHDDGYKHDEYKRDEPHYNHLTVRDHRDLRFVDKDNYSLEPSNEQYVQNPYGAYRNLEKEKKWKESQDEQEERARDLAWYRRQQMRTYAHTLDRGFAPEPPGWHSPARSPYNHYNGNRRWE
jgi:hypothetical protein